MAFLYNSADSGLMLGTPAFCSERPECKSGDRLS